MISEKIWFYLHDEDRKGPFDLATIRQLLEAGVITPETWVAREGDPGWIPAVEASDSVSAPPRSATPQPAFEKDISPPSAPSDSSFLYWAGIPLFVFFISGTVFKAKVAAMRFPDGIVQTREMSDSILAGVHELIPKTLPNLQQDIVSALLMFIGCLIPGLIFCGFHQFNSEIRIKEQRIPVMGRISQVIIWGVVIVGCIILSLYASTTRTYALLSMLGRYDLGSHLFGWFSATLAVLFLLSLYALRLSRNQRKQAERTGARAEKIALIASGWSEITIMLILMASVLPIVGGFIKTTHNNPDAVFIERMILAIDQTEHETQIVSRIGEMNMADTFALVTPPVISNLEIGSKLDGILKNECPEILMKDGTPLDTWNRLPFRVALDSNGDRVVDLGGRKLDARAVIWSVGFNGKDELGSGDDVVRILK